MNLTPEQMKNLKPEDEAALEAVRVAALGKKGSISALLSTLGKMSPDERKTQGAAINLTKDKVTHALTARLADQAVMAGAIDEARKVRPELQRPCIDVARNVRRRARHDTNLAQSRNCHRQR